MPTLDDFIIRRSTLKDVPAISKLLEEASMPDDPEFRLIVGSGIVPQQEMIDFVVATHTHSSVILHPCSLVATIRSFDDGCRGGSSKVVAFRLSCEAHHPGHVDEDSTIQVMIEKSSGLQRRARLFKDIEFGGMDVDVDTTPFSSGSKEGSIDFLQLTVDPSYRRQGLAAKLIHESIAIAKSLPESRCINVCAASRYTSRIFQDLGFQKLSQIRYRTYQQDDDDGKPFFNADLVDEHESMELYRLNIEKRTL